MIKKEQELFLLSAFCSEIRNDLVKFRKYSSSWAGTTTKVPGEFGKSITRSIPSGYASNQTSYFIVD